ncbi:thioredoxin [Halegenticoccus soli]|uniref:thioredoxin n=1 Tax=Halegenticoccus soli TaxID=1985678 RepID=UPI000C6DDD61|nr:thioredoxin [Halegenticoccus soli]
MTDADELDEIRRRKREELEARLRERTEHEATREPIPVRSADHLTELLDDHDVVLADFYADWCGPCKMLEPIVAEIARDTPAAVAKVNIDARRDLAAQYGVRSVPTLVLFADGDPVERIVGVREKHVLAELVERYRSE